MNQESLGIKRGKNRGPEKKPSRRVSDLKHKLYTNKNSPQNTRTVQKDPESQPAEPRHRVTTETEDAGMD